MKPTKMKPVKTTVWKGKQLSLAPKTVKPQTKKK
jgi:hypothetical protein